MISFIELLSTGLHSTIESSHNPPVLIHLISELMFEAVASEHNLVPKTLLLLFLLTISICAGVIIHKKHWIYFPETTATILVGILAGLIFQILADNDKIIQLQSDFFMVVLLPPIMFEAGYSMKRVNFFKNFHTIMALAFLGTAFSAFCTAIVLYLGCQLFTFKVSFLEALTFGSLISATDPV